MPTDNKLVLVRQLVEAARNNLETATQLLGGLTSSNETESGTPHPHASGGGMQRTDQGAVIIEGVFDGQNMVGPDGKLYSVPANYASKSKLVEGDLLKLTISPDGSFIYKQIGPVERDRLVGVLVHDDQADEYRVLVKGKFYRVLLASVTYFKADIGDEVVVLVPKGTASSWAAVENVMKKSSGMPSLAEAESGEAANQATDAFTAPAPAKRGPGRPRKHPTPTEPAPTGNTPEPHQPPPPPGIEF